MPLPRLLVLLLALSSAALAQAGEADVAKTIERNYLHRLLTLRGLYRTENLHFGADGSALGNPEVAFATSDARFEVQSATLKGNQLTLTGDLPLAFYDENEKSVSYHSGLTKRTIEIDLADASPAAAMETFWKVFFRPDETVPATCTLEEFRKEREEAAAKPRPSKDQQLESSLEFGQRGQQAAHCRANGDRIVSDVVRRNGGVKAPRATYTPDPEYPKNQRLTGKVILQLIVDRTGHASAMIVEKTFAPGYDEAAAAAVHTWKFAPATREGEPIPVVVNVEVEFHRD